MRTCRRSATGCATGMSGSLIDLGNGRNAVLVTVDGFTISSGASLTTGGPVPIVFAVLGDATINGSLISASAGRGSCDAGDGQNAQGNGVTKAGGGGGGFGADGGTGGLGNGGLGTAGAGGASNASSLTPLVGGCPGGSGAPNEANGAAGGGAIQLSVAGTLTIAGTVATPGRGGLGGSSTAGGGGGGSGGAILLEANTLNIAASGALTANGGSGGCGGQNNSSGSNGVSGSTGDATPAQPSCGASSGIGGTGGTGTFDAANGGSGRGATAGGGGGGGAVGRIRINATACSLSGVRSPVPASNTSSCAR